MYIISNHEDTTYGVPRTTCAPVRWEYRRCQGTGTVPARSNEVVRVKGQGSRVYLQKLKGKERRKKERY
jgi:hypothetical protein